MNKKSLSILFVGSLLVLAGCGKSSVTPSSSSSSEEPEATELEKAYAAMAGNNGTVTVGDYAITRFFSSKAVHVEYVADYANYGNIGYLINGDQGIYEFTLDDDGSLEYGYIAYKAATEDAIDGLAYNLKDLASCGADAWTANEDGSYSTTDTDTLDALCYLDGNSYSYADEMTDTKLTVKNGAMTFTCTVDFSADYGTHDYDYNMELTISDIGTTTDAAIDAAIANPVAQKGLSEGFSDDLRNDMLAYAGEYLPDFAWSAESGISYYNGFAVYDLSVGNNVDEYSALLAENGWSLYDSGRYSGMDDDWNYIDWAEGDDDWYQYATYYKDAYNNDGELVMEYTIAIEYTTEAYFNDSYWTDEYTGLYPDGQFSINCQATAYHSADEMAADLATLVGDDGTTRLIPDIAWTSAPSGITFNNYDEAAAAWGYCAFYDRSYVGNFADEDTAIAQLTIAENALLAAGYVAYNDGTYDYTIANQDNTGWGGVYDKTFGDYLCEVQLSYYEDGSFTFVVIY